ncbi:MAG: SRPBCC family protein [Vicinamibacterales bacterium]
MRLFDVQSVEIDAPRNAVFEFLREPRNLPRWTHAFKSADDAQARLETPAGVVDVQLRTFADPTSGTVDWELRFPDGSLGSAESRVTTTRRGTCIYSFVLHAPPMALEQIEGALETQRETLRKELGTLKSLMER